jgi:hypothetical protein
LLLVIGSRLLYTVAAAIYLPTFMHVVWLVGFLVQTSQSLFFDANKVTGMMRLSEEGYKAMFGNAAVGYLNGAVTLFLSSFEICRHLAILKLLGESDAVNVVAVLPARVFGSELSLTNLNLVSGPPCAPPLAPLALSHSLTLSRHPPRR